jgi:immune inhibitor A
VDHREARRRVVVVLATVVVAGCCCCQMGAAYVGWEGYEFFQEQLAFLIPERAPAPVPELYQTRPESDEVTLATLTETEIPVRDLRELTMRLRGAEDVPLVVRELPVARQVGDEETFWVGDMRDPEDPRYRQELARLAYISEHAYFWVEDEYEIDPDGLRRSAERFDATYERTRAIFGHEWSPGIDADPRVHIYNGGAHGVGGYFSAADEFPQVVNPHSNEREMFYINVAAVVPGELEYDSVLAHEFQHMIHWNLDRSEPSWTNEGCSELAMALNGYPADGAELIFAVFGADTQLNAWANVPGRAIPHYGASFAFIGYFHGRFGDEALRALVADQQDGRAGLEAELATHGYGFDEFFQEWTVANYVDDGSIAGGRFSSPVLQQPISPARTYTRYPAQRSTAVHQYGADYVVFEPEDGSAGVLSIDFEGATRARLLPMLPREGEHFWYSHRGDGMDVRLTHRFDLGGVDSATLTYWTWYDIERGWDYGYVEASADGGETWTLLPGRLTSDYNPAGNAYGPGLTGSSRGWKRERVDLSSFAGQEILLRFEYVTDDAYNTPGWAVDGIEIAEIGFIDDVESGEGSWDADGFVRVTNFLPQRYGLLFLVYDRSGGLEIQGGVEEASRREWSVAGFGSDVERVVMIVSGLAPVTTEWFYYQYQAVLE